LAVAFDEDAMFESVGRANVARSVLDGHSTSRG
jgi:predicted HAD superfamily Cof-like phosphohydrolase